MIKKTAVVLFNLGGPANLDSVRPFLFNLFYDKAIIRLPNPFRWLIAKIISTLRAKTAQAIYSEVGGSSPILKETEKQAAALTKKLGNNFEVFICMRYAPPMSDEVAQKIKDYAPDEIIMLPLYPQFSTTTTGSSIADLKQALAKHKVAASQKVMCCYKTGEGFIKAHVDLIEKTIEPLEDKNNIRILFSAHGLPQKIIDAGDPYQKQVEETVGAIMKNLPGEVIIDHKITYQSRVGPMKWLQPSTIDEIKVAAKLKKTIIVVPVAFVSEHVETLVELDIEYAEIAKNMGAKYLRVPALGTHDDFIEDLAKNVRALAGAEGKGYGELLRVVQGSSCDFCNCMDGRDVLPS